VKLLQRCQEVSINTCQAAKREIKHLLAMQPRPIGFQQFGAVSDRMLAAGKLDQLQDCLKQMRDTGLLVGLGAHNPRVIEHAEERGWDVDFYECCFYQRVHGKVWNDQERRRMVQLIRKVSKPCIAFKVLAGNRHTKTPRDVYNALKFVFDNIKPTDVVLLGMWQKYKDQVGENAGFALKILGKGA